VEDHYRLKHVPVEDALPLYGISKFIRLGCWSCFNPWKWKADDTEDLKAESELLFAQSKAETSFKSKFGGGKQMDQLKNLLDQEAR
jgi:3'-phosphoadenosine 5'-phosphosulfate sulfotransferase (PAPS reductase)/FAD synthetase